jgi:chloramphenicol 3-O phosphotransferase
VTKSKIILLNGASSAGKSTLAKAIQRDIEEPFWHIASDQFVEAKMLPQRRDEGGEFAWSVMRPRFFDAFHRCLPAIASAGNNLIIDHVIEFATWMNELVELLVPFDVFFVAVHCSLAELEHRERERGDRMIGEAYDHLQVVHTFGGYDFEIDTTTATPHENTQSVITAWKARTAPSAFQRMYLRRNQD